MEILLFFPSLAFKLPEKDSNTGKLKKYDAENMENGMIALICIFGLAFILDYFIKSKDPSMYIPGGQSIWLGTFKYISNNCTEWNNSEKSLENKCTVWNNHKGPS